MEDSTGRNSLTLNELEDKKSEEEDSIVLDSILAVGDNTRSDPLNLNGPAGMRMARELDRAHPTTESLNVFGPGSLQPLAT